MRRFIVVASLFVVPLALATVRAVTQPPTFSSAGGTQDVAVVHADIVANGIPGAGAITQVGTFHRGGPFVERPGLASAAHPVLDRARLLVASTSNFGAPLALAQPEGSILSIDISEGAVAKNGHAFGRPRLLDGLKMKRIAGSRVSDATASLNVGRMASYGRLPLSFEANAGQTDRRVKFVSHSAGQTLFLAPTEAVVVLNQPRSDSDLTKVAGHSASGPARSAVLRMKLLGANPHAQVVGVESLPGKANYFIGSDPKKWRTNVSTYRKVQSRQVYPGIDALYYGNPRELEYDFIVAPGADPGRIRLAIAGAEHISIDDRGDVVLRIGAADLHLQRPRLYQDVEGKQQEIAGGYVFNGRELRFHVAAYDHRRPLVIDPVLAYSTYLGGSDLDDGIAIAVDAAGNAYVTGLTRSLNFPTTAGAYQSTFNQGAAFVAKIDATQSGAPSLVYSTFLGSTASGYAAGLGIAVDASGNAYVTGVTNSTSFPVTAATAYQPAFTGGPDGFMTQLNSTGTALLYSTFLGGSATNYPLGIAVDTSGSAYVTGLTSSTDFPVSAGAYQSTNNTTNPYACGQTVFMTKLDPSKSGAASLAYSTYLGGTCGEIGYAIAVDAGGNAYVTGSTVSVDFPVKPNPGAFQVSVNGNGTFSRYDAFIAKLDPTQSGAASLVYSTYLGGELDDYGQGIAVDAAGNPYVTGYTASTNSSSSFPFPTTGNAYQITGFGDAAFVTKMNSTGTAQLYSTFLSGNAGGEFGYGIAVDGAGNAYVIGTTYSSNFPVSPDAFQKTRSGFAPNFFVTKLNPAQSGALSLVYSTYLGEQAASNRSPGIAADAGGNAYVTGSTYSTNFPDSTNYPITVATGYQPTNAGGSDAFVAKIAPCAGTPGAWTPTGSMPTARMAHTATRLPNGKVLIAGGRDIVTSLDPVASAVLYDPATGTFASTGSMATARLGHTATLLPNGKVLIAGGTTTGALCLNSAELYDPTANNGAGAFTSAASMNTFRDEYTATLLPNGKVLMAGGACAGGSSAELYDPAANNGNGGFTATGPMSAIRVSHTATLLANGNVLVAGGMDTINQLVLDSAEIYDPAANIGAGAFSGTGSMAAARQSHRATLLPSGGVLVTGGYDAAVNPLDSAEVFDPGSGAFTTTGSMATARAGHTATRLPNGKVLIAGGLYAASGVPATFLNSAELYDPAANGGAGAFAPTGPLGTARELHSATLLPDGRVLAAGGQGTGPAVLASAELYTPIMCTPAPTISTLAQELQSFNLPQGIDASLTAKLNAAQAALLRQSSASNGGTACNQLDAFVNQVQAQRGKTLEADQADQLIEAAGQVKATLGCPSPVRGKR